MEVSALELAATALGIMLDPSRLMVLAAGVLVGLTIGVIPGLGGIVGIALLIPFTFEMDAYSAFAFLIGIGAVTTTSDTVPAVLFGVPGTTGSAATILDGHPLAKQGQAGRAFGAAYTASLLGGLAGAVLLGISIPVLRPIILYLGSPELLAICVFGLSMVAVLSGKAPLRGMVAAGLGLMVAMVGSDPQTGTMRWTFDTLYLWDGLPLIPITLGLFALPELADLAITRRSIGGDARVDTRSGQLAGVRDALRRWWLVLRCSWIGAALGAVPGMGAAVIDWLAYGHALKTEKQTQRFGEGDIRGVIASESSNNAKEGGALVPTLAFGVPGSASMAILLGAFTMHGLVPGPRMLGENLEVTYSIVWSLALANVLGAGLCLAFSNQLARVATLRVGLLVPRGAGGDLPRRVSGVAPVGGPVRAARLRRVRLGDETAGLAAPAADTGRGPRGHRRALPVHFREPLRMDLDQQAAGDRVFRPGGDRAGGTAAAQSPRGGAQGLGGRMAGALLGCRAVHPRGDGGAGGLGGERLAMELRGPGSSRWRWSTRRWSALR